MQHNEPSCNNPIISGSSLILQTPVIPVMQPDAPPQPPICSGWLVAYRDRTGKLRGGCDEREAGTVKECRWDEGKWTVCLTDGQQLPLLIILAVGKTDAHGHVLAAWDVKRHGYDGRRLEASHE